LLIIAIVLGIRWIIFRAIRGKSETLSPKQRKWISSTRNIAIIIIFILLLSVWSLELSRFALAIVIARKELTLCLLGGIYSTITHPFSVGDWIEVGPIRGEVLKKLNQHDLTGDPSAPRYHTKLYRKNHNYDQFDAFGAFRDERKPSQKFCHPYFYNHFECHSYITEI